MAGRVVEDGVRMLQCRQVAQLPTLEEPAEQIFAVTVSVFGQLAVLTRPRSGQADQPGDCAGRVYLHDGDQGWWSIRLDGPAVTYPLLDLMPDGNILVVDARCRRYRDGTADDNAHVFDSAGPHLRSFCLGDGIERLGVDAAGTIWVGYFDEGVFGNRGWRDPIGAAGLVRFDSHGQRLWTYQPPSAAQAIIDCYALNVDARTTWTYYYTDFPLVKITSGRARAYAPTPVRGARHLLVYRDEVIFVADYDDPLRLTDCRLTDTTVQYRSRAILLDPDGTPLQLFDPITAHGSRLYLHADRRILHTDLADHHRT